MAKTLDELAAASKVNHSKRFAVIRDGKAYGLQAKKVLAAGPQKGENKVKKVDHVDIILVPVEQASGFDKISSALRTLGRAGKEELPVFEEAFEKLDLEYEVAGTKENKNGETVDIYSLKSASIEGFDGDFVTVASLKDMTKDERHDNEVEMTFGKAEMSESVAANAEAMKAKAAAEKEAAKA